MTASKRTAFSGHVNRLKALLRELAKKKNRSKRTSNENRYFGTCEQADMQLKNLPVYMSRKKRFFLSVFFERFFFLPYSSKKGLSAKKQLLFLRRPAKKKELLEKNWTCKLATYVTV